MTELKSILDRALEGFEPVPDAFERTLARVQQRRRRRRMTAGAAGVLVVMLCLVAALILIPGQSGGRITTTPATAVGPPSIQAVTTLPVSGGLSDLAVGDGSLWVPGNGVVQRLDATTGSTQAQIPVQGASDRRYVAVGAGGVWVTDTGTQQVTRIDPSTNQVVATVSLDAIPNGIQAVSDAVWVTYTRATSGGPRADTGVVVIDPQTNQPGTPIRFSQRGATAIAVGDDHVWVSDGLVVAHDTGRHLTTAFRLPRAYQGLQLVAAGDRGLWFIGSRGTAGANGSKTIAVRIDTRAINSPNFSPVARPIAIPQAVRVAVTENAVWVLTNRNNPTGSRPGQLWALDPRTLKIVGKPITVGTTPVRLLATPNTVWVANFTESTITRVALRPRR
jgi:streptogramin lyase